MIYHNRECPGCNHGRNCDGCCLYQETSAYYCDKHKTRLAVCVIDDEYMCKVCAINALMECAEDNYSIGEVAKRFGMKYEDIDLR